MTDTYNFHQMLIKNDFPAAVDFGLVKGINSDAKFGHCPDAPAGATDVWELGKTIQDYIFPDDAGEDVLLLSDDDADEGKLIEFEVIDLLGFEQTIEHPCGTVATPTLVEGPFRAINRIANVGNTLTVGLLTVVGDGVTSSNTFAALSPDDQQSSQAIYMAPINKVTRINNFSNAINRLTGVTVSSIDRLAIQLPDGVFRTQIRYGLQKDGTSNISSDLIVGIALPPLVKIKLSAEPSAVDSDVSAEWSMNQYDTTLMGVTAVNQVLARWGQPTI